jgi:Enolase C-terminal domain-like/Catechol dioxygenase N terminus
MPNQRAIRLFDEFTGLIREFASRNKLTPDEYHAVQKYLISLGEAGEWPLFLDAFFESTIDTINYGTGDWTSSAVLGPYYKEGAPLVTDRPATLPMRPDEPGQPMQFTGTVRDRDDLAGMAELRRRATTMWIVADESVSRPGDALAAVSARACDAVAVKPGKAGGLTRAAQVAAVTTAAGLACYGGSALETSIGTAAAAHLFAALPELALGCELAGPLLLADDLVTNPVRYADGNLQVPQGPGLGVTVNWDNVDRYARRPT